MIRVAELMDVRRSASSTASAPSPRSSPRPTAPAPLLMVSPIGVFETCGLIYQSLAAAPATPAARA